MVLQLILMWIMLAVITLLLLKVLGVIYDNRMFQQKIVSMLEADVRFKERVVNANRWFTESMTYTLIAMCRYIDSIKDVAVREERYEDAQRCQQVINEINELIKETE